MTAARTVTLIGLGAMGLPMATVLAKAGFDLTVWNRTPRALGHIEGATVRVASSPADAAGPVVLTLLPDIAEVRSLLDGDDSLLAGWAMAGEQSPILVIMGTVSPVAVRELGADLARVGVRLVDAPVSGGVVGAAEARLSIMVGGAAEDAAELSEIFEALGSVVRHLGPLGSGELAKACNQMIVAASVSAISEAMLLGRRAGLDLEVLQELLLGGLANSEVLRQKGRNWIEESFVPGGTAAYQLKDLNFSLAAATELDLTLPVTTAVRELFRTLESQGDAGLDHTGVYVALQRLAGIQPSR